MIEDWSTSVSVGRPHRRLHSPSLALFAFDLLLWSRIHRQQNPILFARFLSVNYVEGRSTYLSLSLVW